MSAQTFSIFIRSYRNDFPWLRYCLRSIQKHLVGFCDIIIAVPAKDVELLSHLTVEKVIGVTDDGTNGYMQQQSDKMHADLHTQADYILHVDSDMWFTRPVTPDFFFRDGKPIWVMTPWSAMGKDEKRAWMHVMTKALQDFPPYEFMRKCANMIPRWLYADFRSHMEQLHGVPLQSYILNQPNHEFSEYNAIGFYAWLHHRDKFYWHDTTVDGIPSWPFKQAWSWGGLKPEIIAEMERDLA